MILTKEDPPEKPASLETVLDPRQWPPEFVHLSSLYMPDVANPTQREDALCAPGNRIATNIDGLSFTEFGGWGAEDYLFSGSSSGGYFERKFPRLNQESLRIFRTTTYRNLPGEYFTVSSQATVIFTQTEKGLVIGVVVECQDPNLLGIIVYGNEHMISGAKYKPSLNMARLPSNAVSTRGNGVGKSGKEMVSDLLRRSGHSVAARHIKTMLEQEAVVNHRLRDLEKVNLELALDEYITDRNTSVHSGQLLEFLAPIIGELRLENIQLQTSDKEDFPDKKINDQYYYDFLITVVELLKEPETKETLANLYLETADRKYGSESAFEFLLRCFLVKQCLFSEQTDKSTKKNAALLLATICIRYVIKEIEAINSNSGQEFLEERAQYLRNQIADARDRLGETERGNIQNTVNDTYRPDIISGNMVTAYYYLYPEKLLREVVDFIHSI